VFRHLGRRFGRGLDPIAAPLEAGDAPAPLPVVAYTDELVARGLLAWDGDRLTDALNAAESLLLTDVVVERLADGTTATMSHMRVARDELAAVAADGPRGDPARRVRTQAQPVLIRSGPYEIKGRVHALAGADPIGSLRRRRPMVPLTMATIGFAVGGQPRFVDTDLLIINRDLIDLLGGPPGEEGEAATLAVEPTNDPATADATPPRASRARPPTPPR
jgi:hypothetical protein